MCKKRLESVEVALFFQINSHFIFLIDIRAAEGTPPLRFYLFVKALHRTSNSTKAEGNFFILFLSTAQLNVHHICFAASHCEPTKKKHQLNCIYNNLASASCFTRWGSNRHTTLQLIRNPNNISYTYRHINQNQYILMKRRKKKVKIKKNRGQTTNSDNHMER